MNLIFFIFLLFFKSFDFQLFEFKHDLNIDFILKIKGMTNFFNY